MNINTNNQAETVLNYITSEYQMLKHLITYQRNRVLVTIPFFVGVLYIIHEMLVTHSSKYEITYMLLMFVLPYLINIANVYLINSALALVEDRLDIKTNLKVSLFGFDLEHAWLLSLVYFMVVFTY